MYKGGVGVKGDNSWESWWDEEQVSYEILFWIVPYISQQVNLNLYFKHPLRNNPPPPRCASLFFFCGGTLQKQMVRRVILTP